MTTITSEILPLTETAAHVEAKASCLDGKILILGLDYETMAWGKVIHQKSAHRVPKVHADGTVTVAMFGSRYFVLTKLVGTTDSDYKAVLFELGPERCRECGEPITEASHRHGGRCPKCDPDIIQCHDCGTNLDRRESEACGYRDEDDNHVCEKCYESAPAPESFTSPTKISVTHNYLVLPVTAEERKQYGVEPRYEHALYNSDGLREGWFDSVADAQDYLKRLDEFSEADSVTIQS